MSDNVSRKSPYFTIMQAASHLLVKPSTLNKWRHLGIGPVFRTHGGRIVYLIEDLDAWSESQKHQKAFPPVRHKPTSSDDGDNK
ncbi:MAG: helix-turn-helix domain-containing protein [Rhizobiales bacterium]|nr:helix-turn-helix domain-containing protein [Hyphomicrobiales bacterium]